MTKNLKYDPATATYPYLEACREIREEVGVPLEEAKFLLFCIHGPANSVPGGAPIVPTATREDSEAALRILRPLCKVYSKSDLLIVCEVFEKGAVQVDADQPWVWRFPRKHEHHFMVFGRVSSRAKAFAILNHPEQILNVGIWDFFSTADGLMSIWDGDTIVPARRVTL